MPHVLRLRLLRLQWVFLPICVFCRCLVGLIFALDGALDGYLLIDEHSLGGPTDSAHLVWDVVIEVLHSSKNMKSPTQEAAGNRLQKGSSERKFQHHFKEVDHLSDLDHVVTNANSFPCEVQLYFRI